jgi:hypothetical protein
LEERRVDEGRRQLAQWLASERAREAEEWQPLRALKDVAQHLLSQLTPQTDDPLRLVEFDDVATTTVRLVLPESRLDLAKAYLVRPVDPPPPHAERLS